MSIATYPETVQLLERTSAGGGRVDKVAGVIRGVRILGRHSKNNREYSPEAIRRGARLYEGIAVNTDHPSGPRSDRSVADRIGWLQGVHESDGGLKGNLHLILSHPFASAVLEMAERNPSMLGLSHNAEGRIVKRDGKNIVEEITHVRSVDLVADPATANSLFESESMMYSTYPRDAAEFAARLLESDGLPMADVVPPVGQADDLDADRELTALQKAAIDAIESAKTADDLTAKLQALVDARGSTSAEPADESYRPTDVDEFVNRLTEGESDYRRHAGRETPMDTASFARALLDN